MTTLEPHAHDEARSAEKGLEDPACDPFMSDGRDRCPKLDCGGELWV